MLNARKIQEFVILIFRSFLKYPREVFFRSSMSNISMFEGTRMIVLFFQRIYQTFMLHIHFPKNNNESDSSCGKRGKQKSAKNKRGGCVRKTLSCVLVNSKV